jgi:CBS domain-containing protein
MRAEEIMQKEVVTVSPEDSLEETARRLLDRGISGLPVVDKAGAVVGIISEEDLVRRHKRAKVPAVMEILGAVIFLEDPQAFYEDLRAMAAVKVQELMTRKVFTVPLDASVEEMATLMVEQKINRLPVVDAGGRLAGIVTRQDLVRALLKD